MPKILKAFQINVNGKNVDYRLGKDLELSEVQEFFDKKYKVIKLWPGGRHVLGILKKGNDEFFLKLATTEGISAVTKIEYTWNEEFHKQTSVNSRFLVPKNYDHGFYKNLFYLITEIFSGQLLAEKPEKNSLVKSFSDNLINIIDFSEYIQNLCLKPLSDLDFNSYQEQFLSKARSWYKDIPENITEKYRLKKLLTVVEIGTPLLQKRPRHGDFTPWHLFFLKSGKLGLIDGEHAMGNGVEYYDIGYLIQRIYSVLENPELSGKFLQILLKRNYDPKKIQVILSSRALGGYLDESLKENPDYTFTSDFQNWVLNHPSFRT